MIALLIASAFACGTDGLEQGPVALGLLDGQLGAAPRLNPCTEAAISGGAFLMDDTGNNHIYGQILLEGNLDGSVAIGDKSQVFARVEAFRQHQVISLVGATYTGPGHTSLGATTLLVGDPGDDLVVGGTARLVLPTAFGLYRHQWPVGLDLGAGVSWTATSAVRVHGQLSLATSVGIGRGPHQVRAGLAPTVGVELVPGRHFAFVLDVVSSLGYQAGLDWVAPALSIRTAIGPRVGVELNALLPLVGPTPRALARAGLRVTVRL